MLYLGSVGVQSWVKNQWVEKWSREESETELKSFINQLSGVQRLQVAELKQHEKVTRKSRKKVFWEKLELPIVIVSVEVPVTYTYYVDLKETWSAVEQSPGDWLVVVPDLEFNPPAAEISQLQVKIEKSSLFRNEMEIKNQILSQMSAYLRERAEAHRPLVMEQARKEIQALVKQWLEQAQKSNDHVKVLFLSENQSSQPNH